MTFLNRIIHMVSKLAIGNTVCNVREEHKIKTWLLYLCYFSQSGQLRRILISFVAALRDFLVGVAEQAY